MVTPELLTKYGLELGNQILAEDKHLPLYQVGASGCVAGVTWPVLC